MDFNEFSENVVKSIKTCLGDDVKVEVKKVRKNNDVKLHGLIISKEQSSVSPTIYLDGFFRDHQQGKALGDIVYEIVDIYEKNKVSANINLDFFLDYSAVKGRIFIKVIHYDKNKEMLEEVPYIRFMDLAVVCYYAYINDFLGKGSIQIETGHLDRWGISEEELFAAAKSNTQNKLGVEIKGMDEILLEMLSENGEEIDQEDLKSMLQHSEKEVPMYIMTLKGRYFGAACIFYEEMLAAFGRQCQKSFYILPSSIHELILVPDSGREKPEALRRMVQEVNAGHVAPEERLSDNVYYYNLQEGCLHML
ncbi:MAG: hypothetical protein J1E83_03030 [Lachnospiraceae bacterium]|nr:hypothetical protein [Lachnospiraceae bacterium]